MKHVVVTGGHMTPALAVMEVLRERGWRVTYIARHRALEGDESASPEAKEVRRAGFEVITITTGRWPRQLNWQSLVSVFKLPSGLAHVFGILRRVRPDVILSFGSYVAVPVTLLGWLMKIPIVTQEQTLAIGAANRLISKFARKICLAWETSAEYFPREKIVFTGNPLRGEIFRIGDPLVPLPKPLLYVTGGSVGAHTINEAVAEIAEDLLKHYTVIHQCGSARDYGDYEKLTGLKSRLPPLLARRYHPYEFIDGSHIGWVLANARLMVARAGVNTVTEIIALKKPAILIPLPISGAGEQEKNTQFLVNWGAARMVPQSQLTPKKLLTEIKALDREHTLLKKNLENMAHALVPDAAKRLAAVVESVV